MATDLDEAIASAMNPTDTVEEVETPEIEVAEAQEAEIPVEEATVQEVTYTAPDQWSGFSKTKFNMLPKEVQKELTEYYSGVSEQKKVYNAIEEALGENKQAAIATYGGIDKMVSHYHQLDRWAATDPVGLIKWFAQGRGINLSELLGQQKAVEGPQNPQPADNALVQKIAELERLVREGQAGAMNQVESEAAQKIEAFSKDPKYPFFNDLKADMGILIQSGQAKDLPEAYQKAMMLNDKTRDQYIQDQLEAKNKEKIASAQKSKQAATIKPTGNVGKGAKSPGKLDEIIQEAMATRV